MGSLSFSWTVRQPRRLREKRIRIIYVHLCVAICANLMDICKTGASCLDLKLEICLEDKNTAVQHWWDVNGVVTAAGLERGQWDVRAAGGQGLLGMRDTHEDSYTHRRTQRLNVNIWTSLQSCCASDRLEHLKKTCVQLVWVTRGEQRKQIMKCIAQICMLPLIRCWLSWLLTFHMTSTRLGLFHRPMNALLLFWTATGDKLCWALWVKSFIVVIFIVVSKTQDTSEIWGPVSFSPQVLWVYIYMETCSVSVSKYQDMLFTNGQHKWVRKKKKVFFLHQTVQLSAPSSSSGVPRQIKLCHRQEQRSVSMSGPPQGDSSHPPPSCCHNVA